MKRVDHSGKTIGSDRMIKRLDKFQSDPSHPYYIVKCLLCGVKREAYLNTNGGSRVMSKRCKCTYKCRVGDIFGNKKVIEIGAGYIIGKCVNCGNVKKYKGRYLNEETKNCTRCLGRNTEKIDRNTAILLMYDNGYTAKSIGIILGISAQRTQFIIKRDRKT